MTGRYVVSIAFMIVIRRMILSRVKFIRMKHRITFIRIPLRLIHPNATKN